VPSKRFGSGRQTLGRAAHDRQVNLTALQQADEMLPIVADPQAHLDVRMQLAKARQQMRHEILCCADHAHGQRTTLQTL